MEQDYKGEIEAEVVPLMDYELRNCTLCGSCFKTGECVFDPEFNRLMEHITDAEGFFLVIPHYSPIPSKLLMVLEKMNELTYAGWINDPAYQSPFNNKPVGLIGHGGMTESDTTLRYYHDRLITPVADTLKSLSFQIVQYSDTYEYGAAFGLKDDTCIRAKENEVFPEILQDWPKIEARIAPLIEKVCKTVLTFY
jgi:multimeric flavodoxin WrbA